jgi:hypothetical protein
MPKAKRVSWSRFTSLRSEREAERAIEVGTSARGPRRAALPADSAVRHLRECQSIYLKLAWQQLAVEGQGRKEKGEGARVHVRCRLSNAGLTVALEGTLALPSRIPADPKTYPSSLTLADRTAGGVRVSVRAAPRMHVVRCWHVVASPAVPPELYAELARVEPAGKGAVASSYSATARALPHRCPDWAHPCYMGRGSPLATSALGGATLLRTRCVAVVATLRADSTLMTTRMLSGAWWVLSCCLLMMRVGC